MCRFLKSMMALSAAVWTILLTKGSSCDFLDGCPTIDSHQAQLLCRYSRDRKINLTTENRLRLLENSRHLALRDMQKRKNVWWHFLVLSTCGRKQHSGSWTASTH